MKSALKLLVFLGIGCLIGIVLVCAGIVSFTDMTWNELVQKLAKIEALEVVGIFAGSIVCTLVAFILQIVLHEGGHLLFGLLSGYRFVSFRIFNWTLIRQEGKFRLKRFGIAGPGGQCLMLPPDQPHLLNEFKRTRLTSLWKRSLLRFTIGEALLSICR